MANALFDSGRGFFLDGSISWSGATIRIMFDDHADDNPDVSVDDYLSDIATAARVPAGTDGTQTAHPQLTSPTTTAGVADAADTTFTTLTGDVSESLIIYKGTLTDTTSPLIAKIDTAAGLPFTPNGGDAIIVYDSGANKIFKL